MNNNNNMYSYAESSTDAMTIINYLRFLDICLLRSKFVKKNYTI